MHKMALKTCTALEFEVVVNQMDSGEIAQEIIIY